MTRVKYNKADINSTVAAAKRLQSDKPFTPKQIKGHLQKLNERWNPKYWIFVGAGTLYLMKYVNGQTQMTRAGGVNQDAIVSQYSHIEADGGDW